MPYYDVLQKSNGRLIVELSTLLSGAHGLVVQRSDETPVGEPTLLLDNRNYKFPNENAVEMRGAPSPAAPGYYTLTVTDTLSIYTDGAIASGRGLAALASFMIGCNSDLGAGTSSCFVSFANAVLLDHFRFFRGGQARPSLTVRWDGELSWSDGTLADDVMVERSAAGTLDVAINAALDVAARFSEPAADETAILVRRNLAGVKTLQRVTMGANDSGGAGFKLLRVPN